MNDVLKIFDLSVMIIIRQLAEKTKACRDQEWDDTKKAHCHNNGERASAFHFTLNGRNIWEVALVSDLFSVLFGHKKDVAIRAQNDHQRDDKHSRDQEYQIPVG